MMSHSSCSLIKKYVLKLHKFGQSFDLQAIITAVDSSGDGRVSLEEFINAIQRNCAALLAEADGEDEGDQDEVEREGDEEDKDENWRSPLSVYATNNYVL